jgi:hypothetical protein
MNHRGSNISSTTKPWLNCSKEEATTYEYLTLKKINFLPTEEESLVILELDVVVHLVAVHGVVLDLDVPVHPVVIC